MMKPNARKLALLALVAAAAAGCDDGALTGSDPSTAADAARSATPERAEDLRVLTWNMFVGGDLESTFLEPTDLPFPVLSAQLWADVQATRFEERAGAIADQVLAADPHVVALQEVSEFRIQSPGDFLAGAPFPNAPDGAARLDFLDLLLDALADRGLAYGAALVSRNFDVEVPMLTPTGGLDDIRLIDYDVILVRDDVVVHDARSFDFDTNFELGPPAFPVELAITRGFGLADITVAGRDYRVAVTHLEPAGEGGEAVHVAQGRQLLEALEETDLPTILVGDFNSGPHRGSTLTYNAILEAGFVDVWTAGRPRGEGPTCCRTKDLLGTDPGLEHRVDIVFYRDALTLRGAPHRGRVRAERVGEAEEDRTASGLWPSDHAGVHAALKPAPAPARAGEGWTSSAGR